jgi:hypothetical protein
VVTGGFLYPTSIAFKVNGIASGLLLDWNESGPITPSVELELR